MAFFPFYSKLCLKFFNSSGASWVRLCFAFSFTFFFSGCVYKMHLSSQRILRSRMLSPCDVSLGEVIRIEFKIGPVEKLGRDPALAGDNLFLF